MMRSELVRVEVTCNSETYIYEIPRDIASLFTKREVDVLLSDRRPDDVMVLFVEMCVGIVPWLWTSACTEALRILLDVMPLDYVINRCRVLLERRYGVDKVTAIAVAIATNDYSTLDEWHDYDFLDDAIEACRRNLWR
jgi:hypothetical protein